MNLFELFELIGDAWQWLLLVPGLCSPWKGRGGIAQVPHLLSIIVNNLAWAYQYKTQSPTIFNSQYHSTTALEQDEESQVLSKYRDKVSGTAITEMIGKSDHLTIYFVFNYDIQRQTFGTFPNIWTTDLRLAPPSENWSIPQTTEVREP